MQRVAVIGAGIGGLTAAAELAAAGHAVTLLEAARTPGGKMREVQVGGRVIDAGPTVFTMRWVFEELFARLGTRLADEVRLTPARLLARHHWEDRSRLDLFADAEASVDAIGRFAGAAEAGRFRRFCARARDVYETLERPFLRASRPSLVTLVQRAGWSGLPALARISPFQTLWQALEADFVDPRLRQLFGRYATYCGSSPYDAPATLMLVAHVEQEGVWFIEGGMQRLAEALARAAAAQGADLRYQSAVTRIVIGQGRVAGVCLDTGEVLPCDAVVFNGDCGALAGGLLGPEAAHAVPSQPAGGRSLSAVTWNVLAHVRGEALTRHNVFFSDAYSDEFRNVFEQGCLPSRPTVYVCAQDQGDEATRDAAAQRLLCLVNAPAAGGNGPDASAIARCEAATRARLARAGLDVDWDPATTVCTTPADFARRFPGSAGALYGAASHGWRSTFRRPGARSRLPGLYLAGGSVHPGPGVPMAALSGRQAAASVLADAARRLRGRTP